jgi:membrane protease YdiL (CAAX protease family)
VTGVTGAGTKGEQLRARALDRLAVIAAAVALVPLPLLGISHPVSQLLVTGVVALFVWASVAPKPDAGVAAALGLSRPPPSPVVFAALGIGITTSALRWLLDSRVLDGRGGLLFYAAAMRQYGVVDAAGRPQWLAFAGLSIVIFVMILLDGLFYVGLMQRRLAIRIGWPAALGTQAALFGLVHAFSGPATDIAYGIGAAIGGLAYGYVYERLRNHWVAATMLWLHVTGVFALMLR